VNSSWCAPQLKLNVRPNDRRWRPWPWNSGATVVTGNIRRLRTFARLAMVDGRSNDSANRLNPPTCTSRRNLFAFISSERCGERSPPPLNLYRSASQIGRLRLLEGRRHDRRHLANLALVRAKRLRAALSREPASTSIGAVQNTSTRVLRQSLLYLSLGPPKPPRAAPRNAAIFMTARFVHQAAHLSGPAQVLGRVHRL